MTSGSTAGPRGIGGWLALLWFNLAIGGPVALVLASISVVTLNKQPNSAITFNGNLHALGLGIANVLMAVFAFTSGIQLRRTARPARLYLIAALVFSLTLDAIFWRLDFRDPLATTRTLAQIVVLVAWIVYLNRSVRVRNTYPTEFL